MFYPCGIVSWAHIWLEYMTLASKNCLLNEILGDAYCFTAEKVCMRLEPGTYVLLFSNLSVPPHKYSLLLLQSQSSSQKRESKLLMYKQPRDGTEDPWWLQRLLVSGFGWPSKC